MAFFNIAAPPNWNANTTAAGKELYPNQDTLGPGEWGFKGTDEVAKLNQDWFADQKKRAPQQNRGLFQPLSGFGGWGGFGGASKDLGF